MKAYFTLTGLAAYHEAHAAALPFSPQLCSVHCISGSTHIV